jgi:glutamyl-tRNA reductase
MIGISNPYSATVETSDPMSYVRKSREVHTQHGPTEKTIFPVSLLLEGRDCLVVGSGKAAAHKAGVLLEAKARVTVVAPEMDEEIQRLSQSGSIRYFQREFEKTDVKGMALAFAATNDKFTNRHILSCCRDEKVFCCSVDGNWSAGDFATPATFRKDSLTVSISSGGRSCRRSRLVRENLARHVEMVETANLIVMGTSHHQLPIQRREPLHLVGERMNETGQMLTQVWGIHEFMLLNTCNRVEFIGVIGKDPGMVGLLKRILAFYHLKEDEFYVKRGAEAFEHVASVSAGLYSQSPGENHIVAQIKESLEYSEKQHWAGGMIAEWIGAALHVSKDIRQVTAPMLGTHEIEDLCLNHLKSRFGDLADKRVMVMGSGVIGTGLIDRFAAQGCQCDLAYHVNRPTLAESWKDQVTISSFNDLQTTLSKVDIVICTAASPGNILHRGHAAFFDQNKDILIIDLAMPRNVEPAMDGVTPHIKVLDLDGLKRWYRQEILDMSRVFEVSSQVVQEHQDLYTKIIQSFQGASKG